MTNERDPFRYCVYCEADCYADDPEHAADCPSVTGLWPVRAEDVKPCENCGHPALGMCCVDCGAELNVGDFYIHRQVEGGAGTCLEDAPVYEVICVGCGAKEAVR